MITLQQAFARAFALEAAGRERDARAIYEQILAAIPDHPGALLKIATSDAQDGQLERAQSQLARALESAMRQSLPTADIWLALGHVRFAAGDRAGARDAFEHASALGHPAADAPRMLAWLALEAGNATLAQRLCRAGLQAFPRDAELLHLLGKALKASGAYAEARSVLQDAAAASGDDPAILVSLGGAAIDAGDGAQARGYLERAIAGGQDTAVAWDNLGLALRQTGDFGGAVAAFERAAALDPSLATARSNLINALRYICRWDEAEPLQQAWLAGLAGGSGGSGNDGGPSPAIDVALPTTPAQQLAIARAWSRLMLPPVAAPAVIAQRGSRLRIGYLTADFYGHATAFLMAGMLECHDKRRFEVSAYSYGPDDGSATRARVIATFDRWLDVRAMSDLQCANRMREDGIDVLIDLKGHTGSSRLGILSHRPSPVQLHYLGYPGTLGFDGVDGIVADAVVVPPGDERHYHEHVWRLPRCYQVNDSKRALPAATPRAALGLPDDALVLACFNQTYKLTRPFFHLWMDVLREVPAAVLWLYAPIALAQENLRAEAQRCGIDPRRVHFAAAVGQDQHIARLRAADLALDVLPYGSHTTGSDALWAGVPMVSCRGDTFAGRVGASLLDAVLLPELVTESPADYRAMLLALATDRARLAAHREHLERDRVRLPLFDTEGFTRDFESLLLAVYDETVARRRGG